MSSPNCSGAERSLKLAVHHVAVHHEVCEPDAQSPLLPDLEILTNRIANLHAVSTRSPKATLRIREDHQEKKAKRKNPIAPRHVGMHHLLYSLQYPRSDKMVKRMLCLAKPRKIQRLSIRWCRGPSQRQSPKRANVQQRRGKQMKGLPLLVSVCSKMFGKARRHLRVRAHQVRHACRHIPLRPKRVSLKRKRYNFNFAY